MLRNTVMIAILVLLAMCVVAGCEKKQTPPPPPPPTTAAPEAPQAAAADTAEPQTKTTEEYKAEAAQEINKENMASELDKVEQEVKADTTATQ